MCWSAGGCGDGLERGEELGAVAGWDLRTVASDPWPVVSGQCRALPLRWRATADGGVRGSKNFSKMIAALERCATEK